MQSSATPASMASSRTPPLSRTFQGGVEGLRTHIRCTGPGVVFGSPPSLNCGGRIIRQTTTRSPSTRHYYFPGWSWRRHLCHHSTFQQTENEWIQTQTNKQSTTNSSPPTRLGDKVVSQTRSVATNTFKIMEDITVIQIQNGVNIFIN